MFMTREASQFYLSRVLPFLRHSEIAEALKVTRPTVDRWVKSERVPAKAQDGLEQLLEQLGERFSKLDAEVRKQGVSSAVYHKLASMMYDPPPEQIAEPRDTTNDHVDDFVREIEPLLRTGVSSRRAMKIGARYGLPAHKVYRIVNQMGVIKDVRGRGIQSRSTWRLPGEPRPVAPQRETQDHFAEALQRVIRDKGYIEAKEAEQMGVIMGLSERTVHRVAQRIGVKKVVRGFGGDRSSRWVMED